MLAEPGPENRVFQTQDCTLPFQQKGLSGNELPLKGMGRSMGSKASIYVLSPSRHTVNG